VKSFRKSWWCFLALALVIGVGASSSVAGVHSSRGVASAGRMQTLPTFSWGAVAGADHYEFALAADSGFGSAVLGGDGHFNTRSTKATVNKTVPSGTYWWHVRAVKKDGGVGNWSAAHRVVVSWSKAPVLASPGSGSRVSYPTPLLLTWRPVPGAAKYDVSIATDAGLGSLITNSAVETSALSLAPAVALHVGTYFWAVTPVDAEGNKGVRSKVRSFQWVWPSVPTNLAVKDLVGPADVNDPTFGGAFDTALYLPQFSWGAVPGATRYEVEINSDQSWASGSRVCCNEKILRNVFTPLQAFKSNLYYWRVRAFDAQGNAGAWFPAGDGSAADSFVKTFDNVCRPGLSTNCVASDPSIHNLRVEDWAGANVTGGSTGSPVVLWDPVPGAASYEYDVTPYTGGQCNWTAGDQWRGVTAAAGWTPLGTGAGKAPYPDKHNPSVESGTGMAAGPYCVRVRAQAGSDSSGNPVYGDYTYLTAGAAFTYSGFTTPSSAGVVTPTMGEALRQMPVFRWRPVAGAQSYWVIVAKDPSFTNIVDYAFTRTPAYAPRQGTSATTYPDETTTYYWAVLPATTPGGGGASGDPTHASIAGTFQKQVPPTNLTVALDQAQPVFRWKPVPGAKKYELAVSNDPNFGTTVETATTASTSYTAAATYPAGKKLYWRVRADDVNDIGLSWATSSFQYKLPAPAPFGNATSGSLIPTWRWHPVPGAISYDVHVDGPNGSRWDFSNIGTAAMTPTSMTGTGIFHWSVRARFANSVGSANGPYSHHVTFARKIDAPKGARSSGGYRSLLLQWNSIVGASRYQVQVATKPDFSSTVETVTTDGTSYAPRFSSGYDKGGKFYWRVAALDASGNSGDYSPTATFSLPKHK
jgi:hypothetical protein